MASLPPMHVIQVSLPFTVQIMMKSLPAQFELTSVQGIEPGALT
jgi:hypothetical protein